MSDDLLVCVDLQRVFAEPAMPWAVPNFERVIEPTARLVESFGDRVVFTRFVPEPPGEGTAWERYYRQWSFALEEANARAWELEPPFNQLAAGRSTLDLPRFSKWGPRLAALAGSSPLVVCGVSTECCVLSTVLAAADAGWPVRVVADACAGGTAELHEQALGVMTSYVGHVDVVAADQVLATAA
jgi:nicotinamidase-related amidase